MKNSAAPPTIPPLMGLTFGIAAVSAASIFVRYAQVYAPSLVIAAYRLALATLVLAPVAFIRHRDELRALDRRELGLALLSGLFLALHFATWITSLEYTSVASSVVLVTTTPLWVGLLSPFILKERLTRMVMVGMSVALVGGIIVGLSDASDLARQHAFLGDILALTGALMAAAYVLIGRRLRSKMSLVSYIFLVYGMSAGVLVIIMFGAGETPLGYPASAYVWFVLLALVPQLLGHSSFNWALRYLSAAYVSIMLLGEPIGSTILAYFLLRETPSALKIFGAILILAGIYVASQSEARRARLVA